MVSLGDLPNGSGRCRAYGISPDGSTITGSAQVGLNPEAFLWRQEIGLVNLRTYAQAQGVVGLQNWTLYTGNAIAANNKVIVGYGTNPQGKFEAYRLELP
jgi:uncharacterized membrane protein